MVSLARWPAVAIGAMLCTYGLEQWAQSSHIIFVAHPALTNYVTGLILLMALAVSLLKGRPIFTDLPVVAWVTYALFGLSFCSILWSIYPTGSLERWMAFWPYIVTKVVLTPLLVTRPKDIQHGFMSTLALGSVILVLLFTTADWYGRSIILMGSAGVTSSGQNLSNPLAIASLAGAVTLVAILMNFQGIGRAWQILRWFIAAIGLALSIKSGSRGQMIGLIFATLVFLPISRKFKSLGGFLGAATTVVFIGALTYWAFQQYAETYRWDLEEMSESFVSARLMTSQILLERWVSSSPWNWLMGLGSSASFDPNLLGNYPHLVMAEVLGEEGIVGFGLFVTVIFLAFRSIVVIYPVAQPYADARGVLAALGALFVFELVLSFKQGALLGVSHMFTYAIMLGKFELVVRRQVEASQGVEIAQRHPPPRLANTR